MISKTIDAPKHYISIQIHNLSHINYKKKTHTHTHNTTQQNRLKIAQPNLQKP